MINIDLVDIHLLLNIVFYVICCPYTKVEESFNMQALFDLTNFGTNFSSYDHLEFPGVVPRTFIGSIIIAGLTLPISMLISHLQWPVLYNQIAARCVLGIVSWISFVHFRNGVKQKFGERASQLTGVLTAFQFHICFYMSRTLPNVFALILCLNAFAFWLKSQPMRSIVLLTTATVIFRCDILVFLGPFTLQLLLSREIPFMDTAYLGIVTGAVALAITVIVDSIFWQRLVWPEGVVLFFNTVQNKSSEWGVMPYHWYFSNALLKSLNLSLLWVLVGILGFAFPKESLLKAPNGEPRLAAVLHELLLSRGLNYAVLYYIAPALAFICLYSILPHKELRFIFPALPLLTMAGGVGLDAILPVDSSALWYPLSMLRPDPHTRKMKKLDRQRLLTIGYYNLYRHAASAVLLGCLGAMLIIASGLVTASNRNYPGAEALDRLIQQHIPMQLVEHSHIPLSPSFKPVFVHIDAAAAMTGVTRFLQKRFIWGPSNKLSATHHRSYLNLAPSQYDNSLNVCFADHSQCEEDIDLVYYSKHENVTDYTQYDWLITADKSAALATKKFSLAETVYAFKSLDLSWAGFVVNLRPALYILVNVDEQ